MKTIAVIFGGKSTEHDVSVVTAISAVIKPLVASGNYQVEPVYIAKDGAWYWDQHLADIKLYTSGQIEKFLHSDKPVALVLDGGLTLAKPGLRGNRAKIDVVFPATHGTYGEDGSLMGLLRMAGVAYVGCGLEASVLAMNKLLAKTVTGAVGVPSNKYVAIERADFEADALAASSAAAKLKYPLFVKPTRLGSSIGISRVAKPAGLHNALEVAFHYDDQVIVEEEVQNLIELTLPIIGPASDPIPALLERPLTKPGEFFDFDTKYMDQGKKGGGKGGKRGAQGYSEVPAKIDKQLYAKAEKVALDTYKALGCDGIARIDLLANGKTGEVFFNEVNPLPGSLYTHNWQKAGWSSVKLVEKLVELAEARAEREAKASVTFDTNFLKQF